MPYAKFRYMYFDDTQPDSFKVVRRIGYRVHYDDSGYQIGRDGYVTLNESRNLRGLLEWARDLGVEAIRVQKIGPVRGPGCVEHPEGIQGILDVRFTDKSQAHAGFMSHYVMAEWVRNRIIRTPGTWDAPIYGEPDMKAMCKPNKWEYVPDPLPSGFMWHMRGQAEKWAYSYACGHLNAKQLKTALLHVGLEADLRDWTHNILHAFDIATGEQVDLWT